jgi:hypothetical protein
MPWDEKYRMLSEGEIVIQGDEIQNDDGSWRKPKKIGDPAPNPLYTSHRIYRRRKPTRDILAAELRKIAGLASPVNAAKYEAFADRAETGEFDDYADTYVCPITQLHAELMQAGFTKFAARVASGEFDATKQESDEWAASASGQEAAKMLPPEVRELFGLRLNH